MSAFKQLREIFAREVLNTARNPRSLRATCFNAIFTALLVLALFYRIGDPSYTGNNMMTMVFNFLGLAFLVTTNQVMPGFFSVVLQIPLQ